MTPEPPTPDAQRHPLPDDPYSFEQMEQMLRAGIDPSDNMSITIVGLHSLFKFLVLNAHERKLMREPLMDVLDKCCEVHLLTSRLEAAVHYSGGLHKLGQQTPNLDKTIQGILAQIKAVREWGIRHLDVLKELPPPGTKLS